MRHLFLTSSPTGPLDGSRPVFGIDPMNHFTDRLHERWQPYSRVLIITASPYAYKQNDQMCDFFREAFLSSGFTLSTFDLMDARYTFSKEEIESYQVIILGGGHVPTQLSYFHEVQLREKLTDFNGIIIGISAGSMNAADDVYVQPEIAGESSPDFVRWDEGLNLTDINIIPHYQQVKDNWLDGRRLFEDITYADSYGHAFVCLEDGSYLMAENGYTYVCGKSWLIHDATLEFLTDSVIEL